MWRALALLGHGRLVSAAGKGHTEWPLAYGGVRRSALREAAVGRVAP